MRLYLCEKPSQAKDIARVLGATQRGSGCYNGNGIGVTWCIGHLLEAAPPEAYDEAFKRWSIEHLPIIPAHWRINVKPKTAAQFKAVKALIANATEIVIATDADREGEMIAREVLDMCRYRGPVRRLWLSALNDASIRSALSNLRAGDATLSLYLSALARSRADWLIGMNLSRLFTLLGRKAGYDGVLSVGRVQTPTLRLVVDRDREIAAFVPVPYWNVDVALTAQGQHFTAQWVALKACADSAGRCIQPTAASAAAKDLKRAGSATVHSVDTERVREAPPLPFDLGTLQMVCSRSLGLDVQETLDIAQALYEQHKATTYPRSDCGYLPQSMLAEVPTVLNALVKTDPSLRPLVATLDTTQRSAAWNDAKITAHHGIIPTLEPADLSRMSEKEAAVYRLIRAHYLAQFLPHHEYDRTVAALIAGGQTLQAIGKHIAVIGWHSVLQNADDDDEGTQRMQTLPPLLAGNVCSLSNVECKALKTQPPKAYTQGELIRAMKSVAQLVTDPRLKQILKDTTGIGTEATRAGIIQGLLGRGYLVKKGRTIRASDTAFALIDAVPAAVADPGTTAVWEQALGKIESGQLTLEAFVEKQATWITQLVQQHAHATLTLPASSTASQPRSAPRRGGPRRSGSTRS